MAVLITGVEGSIGTELLKQLGDTRIYTTSESIGLKDSDYYEYVHDTGTWIKVPVLMDDVTAVIDLGCTNDQCWVKDDPDGSKMIESMQNNVAKLYKLYSDNISTLRKNNGVFIGIGSNASYLPMSGSSHYCMEKSAYNMWFRVAAREEDRISQSGDHCNFICINPIAIKDTAMPNHLIKQVMETRGYSYERAYADFYKHCHNSEPISCEDIVKHIIHFLDNNKGLNGSCIDLGGNL